MHTNGNTSKAHQKRAYNDDDDDDDDDDDGAITYPIFRVILKIEGGPQRSDLIAHHCRASKHPASEIRKVKKCLPSF